MEKIGWTDYVRNEVLLQVNEQRNILHACRNCLLKQVIEGNIKGEIKLTRKKM